MSAHAVLFGVQIWSIPNPWLLLSANNIGGLETAVTSGQPHFLLRDQPEEWDAYVCECDDNRKNVQENRSILLCVYLLV